MSKSNSTVKKSPKKTDKPKEDLCKCYISGKVAAKIQRAEQGTGETFWINKLSDTTAEVRNNCLCGLCVGDIIEFKSYEDDGEHHPRELVKVIERKSQLYGMSYTFEGIDQIDGKLPDNIQDFLWKIESRGCRFEGVVLGVAALSRPTTMNEEAFFELINSGPMTFTLVKD